MKAATEKLRTLGVRNIVVTGGHLAEPTDLLSETQPNGSLRFRSFPGERVALRATHGTGCAYSTSLACNLAQGRSLIDAVEAAKDYVVGALKGAYEIGKGSGPLNHFFA
jgi:hydroxymethylpyrimidine/phosphomethylpyrimidine kinase